MKNKCANHENTMCDHIPLFQRFEERQSCTQRKNATPKLEGINPHQKMSFSPHSLKCILKNKTKQNNSNINVVHVNTFFHSTVQKKI